MEFCHIVPKKLINVVAGRPRHLVLAHLVESDPEYVEMYRQLKERDNCTIIMDNSAFEQFKKGEPMYPSEKLIELGKKIGADYIVLSDYPKEHWTKTRDKAIEMIPSIKSAGFKTFYVPQSELGDLDGLIESIKWAINNPEINLIGMSILADPIALGIDEGCYNGQLDGMIRMQRTMARWKVFHELEKRKIINRMVIESKLQHRFHILGMQDAVSEIELLEPYFPMIASWDTSSAAWHGLNGIRYDNTPTRLKNGKLNTEVDFDWNDVVTDDVLRDVIDNINTIDEISHHDRY